MSHKNITAVNRKKKKHNLKVVSYVLFGHLTEDYSLGTASQIALRNYFKEVREEPRYIGVIAEKKCSQTSKHYC